MGIFPYHQRQALCPGLKMFTHKISLIVSLFLLSLYLHTAGAYNLRFLKHSPVRHFTEQDWEMANAATRQALRESKDGETVAWENPESQSSGTITPLETKSQNGATCRILKIENRAKGLSASSTYPFCQKPDGSWALQAGDTTRPDDTKANSVQPE
jgi:hypothetical protein